MGSRHRNQHLLDRWPWENLHWQVTAATAVCSGRARDLQQQLQYPVLRNAETFAALPVVSRCHASHSLRRPQLQLSDSGASAEMLDLSNDDQMVYHALLILVTDHCCWQNVVHSAVQRSFSRNAWHRSAADCPKRHPLPLNLVSSPEKGEQTCPPFLPPCHAFSPW